MTYFRRCSSGLREPRQLEYRSPRLHRRDVVRDQHDMAAGARAARAPVDRVRSPGHWSTTTFIAALPATELTASAVFDGAINGASFLAYLQQILAPTLQLGDIVILDISGATKSLACAEPSKRRAPRCAFCRPTRPTSTQSNSYSPSSSRYSDPPPRAPSKPYGRQSANSSPASNRANARTIFENQVMYGRAESALASDRRRRRRCNPLR